MKKSFGVILALALLTVGLLIGSLTNGLATADEGYGAGIDHRDIQWDSVAQKGGVEAVTAFGAMEIEFSRDLGDAAWVAELKLVAFGTEQEVSADNVDFEFDRSGPEGTLEVETHIDGCGEVKLSLESDGEYQDEFKRDFDGDGNLVEISRKITLNASFEDGVVCGLDLDSGSVYEVEGWIILDFTKEFED